LLKLAQAFGTLRPAGQAFGKLRPAGGEYFI